MAPKNKKGSKSDALFGAYKPDDPDSFFEKSPFSCASMISLEFEKGDSLKLHRDLLHRNPKLATLDAVEKTDPWTGKPVPSPQSTILKGISRSAGHVLVQYLYTDNYRTLKWVGPTDSQKKTIAKVETAFEVYAIAREFDLEELEALAIEEITLLSKDVDAFTIINIVKKAYPCAKGNDTWFPIFIKDTIRTAFESSLAPPSAETASETIPDDARAEVQTRDVTLAKLLLQGALEVYREKIDALTVKPTPQPAARPAPLFGSSTAMNNSKKTTSFSAWGSSWGSSWGNHMAEPGIWKFGGTKEEAKEEKATESVLESVDAEPVSAEEVKQDEPDPKKAEAVDEFATWEARTTKSKKDKKKKGENAEPEPELPKEPEPEPMPEPEPEPVPVEAPQAVVEPAAYDPWAVWGTTISKKDKKQKNGKNHKSELEPPKETEPEAEPVPEVIPEPEPMKEEEDDFWGSITASKKYKKKKRCEPELAEPAPMEEPEVMAEPAPAISPIEEGWVGGGPDRWS